MRVFHTFRQIAIAEGISFLVLLFIAMPLKYILHRPQAVLVVGYAHGILFVAFIATALAVVFKYKKNFAWLAKAGLASLLPFGTFVMDKQWKKEEAAVIIK